jgi:hypothetical protein
MKNLAALSLAAIAALLLVVMAVSAVAQPQPPTDRDHERDQFRDLAPPSVACPDQQTIDEVEALRRLGDREAEAITRRSYGCGPVLRPRPGPFER